MIAWAPAGLISVGASCLRKWSITLSAGKCPCAYIPKRILCSSALLPWGHLRPPHHPPTKGASTSRLWSASHQGLPLPDLLLSNLMMAPGTLWGTGDGEWVGQIFSCFLPSLIKTK